MVMMVIRFSAAAAVILQLKPAINSSASKLESLNLNSRRQLVTKQFHSFSIWVTVDVLICYTERHQKGWWFKPLKNINDFIHMSFSPSFTFFSATSAQRHQPAPHYWSPQSPGTSGNHSHHGLMNTHIIIIIIIIINESFFLIHNILLQIAGRICHFKYPSGRWGCCFCHQRAAVWSEECWVEAFLSELAGSFPLWPTTLK